MISLLSEIRDARLLALALFGIGLIVAIIIRIGFRTILTTLAKATPTELDDMLIKRTQNPLFFFIIVVSAGYAYHFSGIWKELALIIDGGLYALTAIIMSILVLRAFNALTHDYKEDVDTTPKLLDFLVASFAFLISLILILAHFNVNITALVTTLGIGGLAVGLALKDTLANLFAGVYIISAKPIRIGDYIDLEQEKARGYVKDITWRETRIRTPWNQTVVLPNSMIANTTITNYYQPRRKMSFGLEIGVAPESNLKKVEKVALRVAKEVQKKVKGGVEEEDPLVRFHTFGKSNIIFTMILYAQDWPKHHLVKHEFIKRLTKAFEKEKIEMAPPTRKVRIIK